MTSDTKSLLKSTILGLLGGGAVSALYSLNSNKDELSSDPEFMKDEITVPLSRRQFLKAVRPETLKARSGKKPSNEQPSLQIPDTSKMTKNELASLKKQLLRKKAVEECSSKIKSVTRPSSHEAPIRNVSGIESTFIRDKKGRFKSEDATKKEAGVLDDASGTIRDSLGLMGGTAIGLAVTKMISDRILINKKRKQVEAARKKYVDSLAREVNDEDLPYYTKKASDRGTIGSTLGLLGLTGITLGTTAGIVMYRVMENRRKLAEKEKDKDLSKYPLDKTINFTFPKDPYLQKQSFFVQRLR